MFRKYFFLTLALIGLCTSGFAASEAKGTVGVVNFTECMSNSKLGVQEQASFEALKTQMTSLLQDTEKQINEMGGKFNDPDYMDGLSPEAEEEMKNKFRVLNEEMNRHQNQYYQVLNQANMKIVQSMGAHIQEAAQTVAANQKLSMVMNKEACFYHTDSLDVTELVIAEMDKAFEQQKAKKTANLDAAITDTKTKK